MPRPVTIVGNFPEKDPEFLAFGRKVETKLTGNPRFTNPPVPPALLGTQLDGYEATVGKKGPGTRQAREEARAKVEAALRQDQGYVEGVVTTLPPAEIPAAVESSGFFEKKPSKRTKQDFAVDRGLLAGSAVCKVKALGRHGTIQYCHAYSLDGGKTWIDEPPTVDTALTINGLPVAQWVSFRFRPLKKGIYGDWSQTLTLLIH